ncbi:MAG: metal-sensitive transcriptional regulator, partial [Verrucomicrobiaceae bacterium]
MERGLQSAWLRKDWILRCGLKSALHPLLPKIPFTFLPILPIGIYMHRNCSDKAPLLARVKKIAGQTQGIARMIGEDRNCPEILHTITAIHS